MQERLNEQYAANRKTKNESRRKYGEFDSSELHDLLTDYSILFRILKRLGLF